MIVDPEREEELRRSFRRHTELMNALRRSHAIARKFFAHDEVFYDNGFNPTKVVIALRLDRYPEDAP